MELNNYFKNFPELTWNDIDLLTRFYNNEISLYWKIYHNDIIKNFLNFYDKNIIYDKNWDKLPENLKETLIELINNNILNLWIYYKARIINNYIWENIMNPFENYFEKPYRIIKDIIFWNNFNKEKSEKIIKKKLLNIKNWLKYTFNKKISINWIELKYNIWNNWRWQPITKRNYYLIKIKFSESKINIKNIIKIQKNFILKSKIIILIFEILLIFTFLFISFNSNINIFLLIYSLIFIIIFPFIIFYIIKNFQINSIELWNDENSNLLIYSNDFNEVKNFLNNETLNYIKNFILKNKYTIYFKDNYIYIQKNYKFNLLNLLQLNTINKQIKIYTEAKEILEFSKELEKIYY